MVSVHVKFPDGRSSSEVAGVIAAYDNEQLWDDPSSEMYVSFREGAEHRMLTVIRRRGVGTCLICRESDDHAPASLVTIGGSATGTVAVELEDVTVRYPARFFIDNRTARRAIETFLVCRRCDEGVSWVTFDETELVFEPFE